MGEVVVQLDGEQPGRPSRQVVRQRAMAGPDLDNDIRRFGLDGIDDLPLYVGIDQEVLAE